MDQLRLATDDQRDIAPFQFPPESREAPAFNRWARSDPSASRDSQHEAERALERAQRKLDELSGMVEEWEPIPFPVRCGDRIDPPPAA